MAFSSSATPARRLEWLIWVAITATYVFYAMGALYLLAPALAWLVVAHLIAKSFYQQGEVELFIPWPVWLWIIGMLLLLVALLIGHIQADLGLGKTIKSTIGWAKGWALMGVFILIGCINLNPAVIYRAGCRLSLYSCLVLPLFVLAYFIGAPERLYISPLSVVGGPGVEFFAVQLHEYDPGTGMPRWRLFAPWAPALGLVANIYLICALHERHPGWRIAGISGCVLMTLVSLSRLALLSMLIVGTVLFLVRRINRPFIWYCSALVMLFLALFSASLVEFADLFLEAFRSARADSSRVRSLLAEIAVTRWFDEAPIWGHGVVERGPHLVEYMPIGSHHTWYGLLFVKGAVGAVALALPLIISLFVFAFHAHRSHTASAAFGVCLILLLYSFGENLEILAYLFWPGLILIGCAFRKIYQEIK